MNWPAALRAAARLGIAPEAFWRLSLAEWRALAGGDASVLSRRDLDRLLKHFPDTTS
ncbi:phage tail assembly chaperone [Maricaulis sp.]|jgi:uncharacterized phage protein (TIGR02216 family)|uniref:phage tail assembly chaperone n=1 Tax=Maricaulis sp. TaxID=1486257 RepID=UPI002613F28A|nr:phage tail assembly chaperone [Maricaulis sp.]